MLGLDSELAFGQVCAVPSLHWHTRLALVLVLIPHVLNKESNFDKKKKINPHSPMESGILPHTDIRGPKHSATVSTSFPVGSRRDIHMS